MLEELVRDIRNTASLLGPEDIFDLALAGPIPLLGVEGDAMIRPAADSAWLGWTATLERLLLHWI